MDIETLNKRIEALEKWKKERETQQFVYPLDFQSQSILGNYFMHITSIVKNFVGSSNNIFTSFIGSQGPNEFQVGSNTFIPYTVNITSNVLTTAGKIYFEDDQNVYVSTEDTPPSPLTTTGNYFVINSTGQSFKLSLTQGGAEINITDVGVGKQYIYFY